MVLIWVGRLGKQHLPVYMVSKATLTMIFLEELEQSGKHWRKPRKTVEEERSKGDIVLIF